MVSTAKKIKAISAVTLPAALLMACGEDDGEEYTAVCVNEDNEVVAENKCDVNNSGGGGGDIDGFFFMMLPSGSPVYTPGMRVPSDRGYTRIGSRDSTARSNAGLPATGPVKSGTKVGGFGKGSPGGSMSGGGS